MLGATITEISHNNVACKGFNPHPAFMLGATGGRPEKKTVPSVSILTQLLCWVQPKIERLRRTEFAVSILTQLLCWVQQCKFVHSHQL